MSEKVPIIVVLGIDVDDKPHASRFDESDAQFVLRAAEMMGFHVIRVPAENAELHKIAAALPLGKIFASGKGFVPFISRVARASNCTTAPLRSAAAALFRSIMICVVHSRYSGVRSEAKVL